MKQQVTIEDPCHRFENKQDSIIAMTFCEDNGGLLLGFPNVKEERPSILLVSLTTLLPPLSLSQDVNVAHVRPAAHCQPWVSARIRPSYIVRSSVLASGPGSSLYNGIQSGNNSDSWQRKSSVRAQSPCIKCYTQLLCSVPAKQGLGRLYKTPLLRLLYSMRSKEPSISRFLKWTLWRPAMQDPKA